MARTLMKSYLSLIILLPSLGQAATGHYDGPAVDYNFVHQKPAKYAECDQYLNLPTARVYAACEFGRDEAERMADRFAGGKGRIYGYLRGYAWGLFKSTRAYKENATEMERAEKIINETTDYDGYMSAGLAAGREKGNEKGQQQGYTDAHNRFVEVLDTGRDPDVTLRIPEVHYEGEDGAYRKYVGEIPDESTIIRNEVQPDRLKVYDGWDEVYLGEVEPVSAWDLFFADGTYVFPKFSWFEKDAALAVWLDRPIDTKPKYENLDNPPLTHSDGTPILDVDGKPIQLKEIFRRSFRNSYEYYVNYYFSRTFSRNLDDGQMAGELVGQQLGLKLAFYSGLEKAFNRKFKESSKASFTDAFSESYSQRFTDTVNHYMNHPVLSLTFDGIVGAVNDGIIEAGELFSAVFRVQNLGGVGTDLNVSVGGQITDENEQTFRIERLRTGEYRAEAIARIAPNVKPRDTARIVLNVNGETAVQQALVQKMIELVRASVDLDVTNGAGDVRVVLENVSTVKTPGMVSVSLLLNGEVVDVQQGGQLNGGEQKNVPLSFEDVDPLALIQGSIQAKLIVSMNGTTMDDRTTMTLKASNPETELVKYFNQLINAKGFIPVGVDREDRIVEVQNRILSTNLNEIRQYRKRGPNLWKKNPGSTILGKLVQTFNGSYQSDEAKDRYDRLASLLWPARKNLPKFLFWGAKRKAYQKLVKDLSKTGEF